jgi:hypothetical protein
VHVLDPPHPSVASLTELAAGYREVPVSGIDDGGVFGIQHTDTNQFVYTGEYTALLEDHATLLLAQAGLPAADHRVERLAVLFKQPFRAGERYLVRGSLHRDGDHSVALVGVHPVSADGPSERAAVVGRVEGRF